MQPHRFVGDGPHHSQVHHPVRHQPQIPMVVALGRRTAGQGDQSLPRTRYGVGFPKWSSFPVPVGLDPVVQRPL